MKLRLYTSSPMIHLHDVSAAQALQHSTNPQSSINARASAKTVEKLSDCEKIDDDDPEHLGMTKPDTRQKNLEKLTFLKDHAHVSVDQAKHATRQGQDQEKGAQSSTVKTDP
ncbi:MAG: hypothetical protein L6R37_006557 [Teloschistes peruensis]|nr:MAG: hypothetical protein L6R37_006557 [Teloschistes peruensis]